MGFFDSFQGNADKGKSSNRSGNKEGAFRKFRSFGVTKGRGQTGDYSQPTRRMRIDVENTSARSFLAHSSIFCHYDPTEFVETYEAEWKITPVTGKGIVPLVYRLSKPRRWQMKLLFNDMGESAARQNLSGRKDVEETISDLYQTMIPAGYTGLSSVAGSSKRPPILLVTLTDFVFRCVLTRMSVRRTELHPESRRAMRAEIDVEFVEFLESAVKS